MQFDASHRTKYMTHFRHNHDIGRSDSNLGDDCPSVGLHRKIWLLNDGFSLILVISFVGGSIQMSEDKIQVTLKYDFYS